MRFDPRCFGGLFSQRSTLADLLLLCYLITGGHPRFWNVNSTIPVDAVKVKSAVNRLFNHASVSMRITINNLYLHSKRIVSGAISVL